jgi:OmpA-OmpF porin, OOP family
VKRILLAAVAFATLPYAACAQNLNNIYVGGRGGANWLLNGGANFSGTESVLGIGSGQIIGTDNVFFAPGFALGGFAGYDFVGPRVEIEALYRNNLGTASTTFPIAGIGTQTILNSRVKVQQTSVMANVYYDFLADQAFTPYVGAGAGIAFIGSHIGPLTDSSDTEFAYQAIIGIGYKVTPNMRLNLDGRYYGTLDPSFNNSFSLPTSTVPATGSVSGSYPNNNFSIMVSVALSFGPPATH